MNILFILLTLLINNVITFSRQKQVLGKNHLIQIFNITSGQLKYSLGNNDTSGYDVTVMAQLENNLLASGMNYVYEDSPISLWNLTAGLLYRTLNGQKAKINSLVSLENNLLASSSNSAVSPNLIIWDVMTGEIFNQASIYANSLFSLSILKCNQSHLILYSPLVIILWDFIKNKTSTLFEVNSYPSSQQLTSVIKFDNDILASLDLSGNVSLWNLTLEKVQSSFKVPSKNPPVSLVQLSNQMIGISCEPTEIPETTAYILVYNVSTGESKIEQTFYVPDGVFFDSSDLQKVNEHNLVSLTSIIDNDTSYLNVWNFASGQLEWSFKTKIDRLTSMTVLNENTILATGSYNSHVLVFDMMSKKLTFTFDSSGPVGLLIGIENKDLLAVACGWLCF